MFLFISSSDLSQYYPYPLSMQKETQIMCYKQGLYKAFALNTAFFSFYVSLNPIIPQGIQDQIFLFSLYFVVAANLVPLVEQCI